MGSAAMSEPAKRILILEDEFYLAEDCAQEVVRHGMQVIGPVYNAEHALKALARNGPDGAIIDLNLKGRLALDVVQALKVRGVPFVVFTGYSKLAFPEPLAETVVVEKPMSATHVVLKLMECLARQESSPSARS
jgi:ActR/RegA family two-component response regulator